MSENDRGALGGGERMRYRTFLLLSTVILTGVGLLTAALAALVDPATNWQRGVAVALGIGGITAISGLLGWRFNRPHLERLGFRRW